MLIEKKKTSNKIKSFHFSYTFSYCKALLYSLLKKKQAESKRRLFSFCLQLNLWFLVLVI